MDRIHVNFMYDRIDHTETLESFRMEIIYLPQTGDRITTNNIFDEHVVIRRDYIYSNGKIFSVNVILEKVK